MRRKYFGIGLSRTGTTSLSFAFRGLGFKSVHYPAPHIYAKIHEYDFANDLPICSRYAELDKRFPGSRFIYTYREVESWLISCESLQSRLLKGKSYSGWPLEYQRETYRTEDGFFDEKLWRETHRRHDEQVREYFANRPADLLIMDITAGDGFDKLIPWIGIPNLRFPWVNLRHTAKA